MKIGKPLREDIVTEDLIKLYESGLSYKQIAKQYNASETTIFNRLKKVGIKSRDKLTSAALTNRNRGLNHDYFETIDTEKKAYFLGLITADGCVYKPTVKGQMQLHLQLKNNDEYIIKKLLEELNLTKQKINNYQNLSKLCICSDKICNDLKKYGIEQRKTYTLKFPQNIPQNMFRHYLRGYFDGDGCVFVDTNHNSIKYACSSLQFLKDLKLKLEQDFNIISNDKISSFNEDSYYSLVYSRQESFKNYYYFFYKESTIYLTRKKLKFETWKKWKKEDLC